MIPKWVWGHLITIRPDVPFHLSSILQIRTAYKKMMVDIVGLLGGNGEAAKRQMMEVYDLEMEIANVSFLRQ